MTARILLPVLLVAASTLPVSSQACNGGCPAGKYCFGGTGHICLDCSLACHSCSGPGADECVVCQVGHSFIGNVCTKCESGKFGPSCNGTCHCLDDEACDHKTGMCTGKCEKGYYNPPQCQDECPDLFYGIDCLGECHCLNDSVCDKVLGFCAEGCHPDWVSYGCSRRLPKLANPPYILMASCDYLTIAWKAWDSEVDFGDLPVAQYRLYKQLNGSDTWDLEVTLQDDPTKDIYTRNVSYLQRDFFYLFRVDVHYKDDGKIVEHASPGLSTEPVLVPCTTTTTPPPKTIPYIVGTDIFDAMLASNQPDNSLLVTWSIPQDLLRFSWSIALSYQMIGVGDCASVSSTAVTDVPLNQTDSSYRITQPSPWAKYFLRLTAQGQDIISAYNGSKEITAVAFEVLPSGNVTGIMAKDIKANSMTLVWTALPCSQRGGQLEFYEVTVKPFNTTGTPFRVTTNVTSAVVDRLAPFTAYEASVRYVNKVGTGPLNDPVTFSTAQGVPAAVNIVSLVATMTSLEVNFQPPQPANGIVSHYYISYSDTPNFILPTSLTFSASFAGTPVIERLKPNTLYYVKVRATTEAGYGPYGSVVSNRTQHSGALAPSSLLLQKRNTTCITLTWVPPDQSTIPVTGYLLTIIKVNSTQGVTQPLSANTTEYTHCNLDAGSAYEVSVTSQAATGVGESISIPVITEQGQPMPPPSPVLVQVTNITATITVEPSSFTQGPITAYRLQVEKKRQPAGRRKRNLAGYVTAQLTPAEINRNKVFVIGDGGQYGGYNNMPLDEGQTYQVYYVVISTWGGTTKTAYIAMNETFTTITTTTVTTTTKLPLVVPPEEDNTGVLIGVILALILLIIIIVAIIIFFLWWRRRQNAMLTSAPYLELDEGQKKKIAVPREPYDPEKYWNEITSLRESRYIVVGRECLPDDQLVPVTTQVAQPGTSKCSFKKEFRSLPHKFDQATTLEAEKHPDRNRFPHILAYDHSRVELAPDASSRCNYINANYMSGYKRQQCYVAAQSPYDDSSAVDFWRLIYQLNIKTVVMIANIVEDNIVKCTQFWPEQGKASIGQFYLELQEEAVYADFTMRDVSVRESREPYGRTVRLFEYTSWPEHGVPDDPIPFLDMRYKVRQYHADEVGPILVHCGTGVARTGVFIAVDSLIEQYASEGRVSVFSFVRKMRKERPLMVRTYKQYVFIYECLLEEFHAGDTMTDTQTIKNKYHDWTSKNLKTGHSFLRDQFQLLQRLTRGPEPENCTAAMLPDNLKRNRYPDVIPSDHHRPVLQTPASLSNTDYVNAIFVNGYRKRNQFILTQTPMHTTLIDFWRMMYDFRVSTIVMMDNYKHEDDTCAEYWPNNVIMKQWEPFFVETTAAFQQENVTIRNLKIKNTLRPRDPPHMVRQFQFNAWAESSFTPVSKTMALDLLDLVLDYQESSDHPDSPIVVHCEDGATHSGLFVSLALLCERMSEEQEVDVYHVIKHIKRQRTQIIHDYDQFRFCYKAMWDYMNLRMPGGTFTDTLGQNKTDKLYGVASLSLTSYQDSLY